MATSSSIDAKQKAQSYLEGLGICPLIQDVLNEICKNSPADPYGYMAEELKKSCPVPTITKIAACSKLHSDGGNAVQVDVYCDVRGQPKIHCAQATVPLLKPLDNAVAAVDDSEEPKPEPKLDAAQYASLTSVALLNCDPTQQSNTDAILSTLTTQPFLSSLTLATSFAAVMAAEKVGGISPYKQIAAMAGVTLHSKNLPTLIMPGLNCRQSIGKLMIESIAFVGPSEADAQTSVESLWAVQAALREVIAEKCGGLVGSTIEGELTASIKLDKLDQALDIVREAIAKCKDGAEETASAQPRLLLTINASDCWNNDKNKYELVQGQLKTAEEITKELLAIGTATDVFGFVNPFRSDHTDHWKNLKTELGNDKFLCCDDATLYTPKEQTEKEDEKEDEKESTIDTEGKDEEIKESEQDTPSTPCNLAVIATSAFSSLSGIVKGVANAREKDLEILYTAQHNNRTNSELAVAIAVGVGAKAFNVGADKSYNFNTFLQIAADIDSSV